MPAESTARIHRPRHACAALVALACVLLAASAACGPPGSPGAEWPTDDRMACEQAGSEDERAICEALRADVESLASLATTSELPDDRGRALEALGHEPCFALGSVCRDLATRLETETDPGPRSLLGPALTCRCGTAAYRLLAEAIRTERDPGSRLRLVNDAADAVLSGRADGAGPDDLLALANVLAGRLEDPAEAPEVRRAAAAALPLLGVPDAASRLEPFADDPDAEVRLRVQAALGRGDDALPGLLDRFRSTDPRERAAALEGLSFAASSVGTSSAVILEAVLIGGEDPSPLVREAAARFDPTPFLAGDRASLCAAVVAHLLRGEVLADAPAELSALRLDELLTSRVRRQVLARAALLAAGVAGPGEVAGGEADAEPFAPLLPLLSSADAETRLVALAALRRGLGEAATVRTPPDPNPVVDAIERGQGDRLRVALSLAGRTIEPGRWEPLLPGTAREALDRPLDAALVDAFHRVQAWRIPGGDDTSEQARVAASYERLFLRGFADESAAAGAARAVADAARVVDLALDAERRAEVALPCLEQAGGARRDESFPRSLGGFRGLAQATEATTCRDEALVLLVEDLAAACAGASGEAGAAVAERCR
jgi:hypothetical protein